MQTLYKLLYVIVFLYVLYHMYTFGITVFNSTVLILLGVSLYLDGRRRQRRAEEQRRRQDEPRR